MALSIKTEEADRLARELAEATHETLTQAVTTALRERLERVRSEQRSEYEERLRRLVEEYQALEVRDDRTADEIIGYDEHGLPT
ncbi:MAG: type II toxin-antitoxin system VapB family antitoxin [Actinomycetes bacterium]